METHIYNRLCAYKRENRISFAMPGHKGKEALQKLFELDVTELSNTIDLMHPDEAVTKSQKLLSKLYRSDESFILTCGSTIAIHAMLCAALKSGDTLLAASDCHMSVVNMCAIMGINIRLIPKEYDCTIPTKTKAISHYLQKYPDIKACLVTSPNYFGVCSDIAELAKECHSHNIPLLVDEAHGAHFVASDKLPKTAIELGADISCQSAHKTLDALTGAAYLHIKSNLVSAERLHTALTMLHSSSPSYPIAASAELAFCKLDSSKWDKWCKICEETKSRIQKNTDIHFLNNDDCTRIVALFDKYESAGFEVAKILSDKYKIDVEMSTPTSVVLITTPSNTKNELEIFAAAVEEIVMQFNKSNSPVTTILPPYSDELIYPQKAFFASKISIPLQNSISHICADTVTVYPPGIPVLYPGSVITKEIVEYLTLAMDNNILVTGIINGNINITEEIL